MLLSVSGDFVMFACASSAVLEAFMNLANDVPSPSPQEPDTRHVPLCAVLLGLDSKSRGFLGAHEQLKKLRPREWMGSFCSYPANRW